MRLMTAAAILLAGTSMADAGTINFSTDGLGNLLLPGATIAEQFASIGVHFVGSAYNDPNDPDDLFASNTDMRLAIAGGDVPPLATFPLGSGNFLHTYSGWLNEDTDGDSNFAVRFDAPILSFSIDVYDDRDGLTQIFAIDANGDIIDEAQSIDFVDSPPQTLTVSATTPFREVAVILGWSQDWVAADNIVYASVPEPVSLGLLPMIGIVLCRVRRAR